MNATSTAMTLHVVAPSNATSFLDQTTSSIKPVAPEHQNSSKTAATTPEPNASAGARASAAETLRAVAQPAGSTPMSTTRPTSDRLHQDRNVPAIRG